MFEDGDGVILSSAQGAVKCDKKAQTQIMSYNENVTPYVLKDTPDLLSIGYRCQAMGYEFRWEPWSDSPTMTPWKMEP